MESPDKDEVDTLKSLFYRFHIAEREQHHKDYLEAGGDPEKYVITPDEDEDSFKAEMQIIKEKRAKIFEKQEAEKAENLKKKLDIIEKIKGMATSPDEANKSFNEFKALQQELRDEIWARFKAASTIINKKHQKHFEALREKEKENLEKKTGLCEKVENITKEDNKTASDWEKHTK